MNEIKIFENSTFGKLRTVELHGEPYFVGKDVAVALGYSNTKDAILTHVDEDDKRILQRSEFATLENHIPKSVFPVNFVSADIPNRGLTIINESGVYALVFGSKLPKAKEFKRWVTSEILPSIRRHGAYMTDDILAKTIENPDFLINLLTEMKEEKQRRIAAEEKIKADRSKVLFAESVEVSKGSILVGDLAKLIKQNGYEIGQKRLFEWLRANGYLMKSGNSYNMPTQYAMELGLFEVKEHVISNPDGSVRVTRTPKVTGKGQRYFINKFLGDGEE